MALPNCCKDPSQFKVTLSFRSIMNGKRYSSFCQKNTQHLEYHASRWDGKENRNNALQKKAGPATGNRQWNRQMEALAHTLFLGDSERSLAYLFDQLIILKTEWCWCD